MLQCQRNIHALLSEEKLVEMPQEYQAALGCFLLPQ